MSMDLKSWAKYYVSMMTMLSKKLKEERKKKGRGAAEYWLFGGEKGEGKMRRKKGEEEGRWRDQGADVAD